MGFVPQDDTMHTDLTVEELLLFAARCRLPAGTNAADHRRHVDQALQVKWNLEKWIRSAARRANVA